MRLHFKEHGQGQPVIILHGLFGSSDNWLGIMPKLAEKFRVFALDLRNHGQSPHSAEMNYSILADDVREFLAAQNLGDAIVMGHSLGGKVAMQFAFSHPQQVQKLIVVDMAPRAYAPAHDRIFSALLALDLNSFQTRQQIEQTLEPAIPSLAVRRFLLKNLNRNSDGGLSWKINLQGLAENYPQLGRMLSAPEPFGGPALFVLGEKSDFVNEADLPLIFRLFPRAKIETIAGAGHWVQADAPDQFVQRVLTFLEQDASSRREATRHARV
jgi:esterase